MKLTQKKIADVFFNSLIISILMGSCTGCDGRKEKNTLRTLLRCVRCEKNLHIGWFGLTPSAKREIKKIIYQHFDLIIESWNSYFKK